MRKTHTVFIALALALVAVCGLSPRPTPHATPTPDPSTVTIDCERDAPIALHMAVNRLWLTGVTGSATNMTFTSGTTGAWPTTGALTAIPVTDTPDGLRKRAKELSDRADAMEKDEREKAWIQKVADQCAPK